MESVYHISTPHPNVCFLSHICVPIAVVSKISLPSDAPRKFHRFEKRLELHRSFTRCHGMQILSIQAIQVIPVIQVWKVWMSFLIPTYPKIFTNCAPKLSDLHDFLRAGILTSCSIAAPLPGSSAFRTSLESSISYQTWTLRRCHWSGGDCWSVEACFWGCIRARIMFIFI